MSQCWVRIDPAGNDRWEFDWHIKFLTESGKVVRRKHDGRALDQDYKEGVYVVKFMPEDNISCWAADRECSDKC